MTTDTIYALATGSGRSALAVLRLSGPAAGPALAALTGRPPPPARTATLAALRHPESRELLDRALVLWFPAPRSQTGEDVGELHLHGGRGVIDGVVEALATMPGLRPAEPGEFSRRAFGYGKLDLTEAEAIADLVDAETAAQRRQALRQFDGELGRLYDGWRSRLIRVLAHVEAAIDFPEDDLPDGLDDTVRTELDALVSALGGHLEDGRRGERLRDGLSVAIIGPPNAGKSSLLNSLARREAAIVSAQSGTTRDIIEVHLNLGGFPLIVADTAGLRDGADEVEQEGVRRARARAAEADIKIAVFDGEQWPDIDSATAALLDDHTLVVLSKLDRHGIAAPLVGERPALALSVRTGAGLPALIEALTTLASRRLDTAGRPTLTRQRHRLALEECRAALTRARLAGLSELVAEDLRLAARALGRITGRVAIDEVLDVIFRDFCIGK
ncbi:MAG: tRNA uridine-5-carboxymethylaminomethyl(34) synthesis GTPase MnmE [Rhodospirillaceae bacterium]